MFGEKGGKGDVPMRPCERSRGTLKTHVVVSGDAHEMWHWRRRFC